MGKASIISYIGVGQYQVQLTLERDRITAAISALTIQIAAMETKIAGMDDGQAKDIATLQKTSMEKRKTQLEGVTDPTVNAWCADMTDDLSGNVGTVEIPGERGTVQIQPGYDSNAAYSAVRDGQLQSAIASTPAGVFYNLAMLPGWQKWKPTYRVGVLSALDLVNNLCTVTLDGAKSSAQALDINQSLTLLSVPIEYMECNALVFENNDRVLVKFENQNWVDPKVIGFETNPRWCAALVLVYGNPEEYLDISYAAESPVFVAESVTCTDGGTGIIADVIDTRLYGSFVKCWSGTLTGLISGATATVSSAIEDHYQRNYAYKNVFAASLSDDTGRPEFTSPLEKPPTSDVSAQGDPASRQEWTKIVDDFCLSAFIHYPLGKGSYGSEKWAVSASFKGEIVTWVRSPYTYYPYDQNYDRQVCFTGTCLFGDEWMDTHIGFDCWTETNEETSETEYYVATMCDVSERFSLFKYNPTTNNMDRTVYKSSTVRDDYFDPASHPEKHVRLLGFGREAKDKYYAYWCWIGEHGSYYKEELLTGEVENIVETSTGYIVTAVWQPVERKLYCIVQESSVADDPNISEFSVQDGECVCSGYYQYWECSMCSSFQYKIINFSGKVSVYAAQCDERQGLDVTSTVLTLAYQVVNINTEFGDFKIGVIVYPGGSGNMRTNRTHRLRTSSYGGYCTDGVSSDIAIEAGSKCTLTDRKDYEFLGGVLSPNGGIAFKYRSVEYEIKDICALDSRPDTVCVRKCLTTVGDCPLNCYSPAHSSSYGDCECAVEDWEDHESGGDEIVAVSGDFPYDQHWRAILLHGVGKFSAGSDTPLTEHEGLIVYKNADTDDLFMMDGAVKTDIGSYKRAYFQQF